VSLTAKRFNIIGFCERGEDPIITSRSFSILPLYPKKARLGRPCLSHEINSVFEPDCYWARGSGRVLLATFFGVDI
jgi:hypothetical protein